MLDTLHAVAAYSRLLLRSGFNKNLAAAVLLTGQLFAASHLSNLALEGLEPAAELLTCHLLRRDLLRSRVPLELRVVRFELLGAGLHLNESRRLSVIKHRYMALAPLHLRGHVDVARRRHHRGLIDLVSGLCGGCLLDDLAIGAVLDLRDGEGDLNLGVILIVDLEVAVVLVILRVVEKSDPLLVLVVLLDALAEEVLFEWHAD